MSVIGSNVLAGASGQAGGGGGYEISRSVRLNAADSAFLSRTPGTAGNRKTWTWAGWVKRSTLSGSRQGIFVCSNGSGTVFTGLEFDASQRINLYDSATSGNVARLTTAVFRDVSSWYHILLSVDTTAATADNRVRLYVNGSEITVFTTKVNPTQNTNTYVNAAVAHSIGSWVPGAGLYFSGYLADIHFIDGQALDPSSFGEFDTNGVWQPKAYTGSFGTNGFHLPFSDNSTAAALGTDNSGAGNTWTVNNISVTAGAGNDSLVDSPVNGSQVDTGVGGEVVGNYATLNPLANGSNVTLSNGNLDYSCASGTNTVATSSIAMSSGKWYCEFTATSANHMFGLYKASVTGNIDYLGVNANGWGYYWTGQKYTNSTGSAYGSSYTTSDVIGVAFDADAGSLYFYKNGAVQNSGTAAFTGLTSGPYVFATGTNDAGTKTAVSNFGQRQWAYAAPAGFKALCTTNLPEPTIADGSTAMDVALYTGNGSTQTISGLNFSPDLVWFKARGATYSHQLYDSVRGGTASLSSNSISAEVTRTGAITSFNLNGFTIGDEGGINDTSIAMAAWCWDAGSSTVTNTEGSITSQVRANASAGFSVVTFTAQSSGSGTIGHGLGVTPEFVIVKSRTGAYSWIVWHKSLTSAAYSLVLNTTAAESTGIDAWANTLPTSSVFSLGSSYAGASNSVAYCWTPVDGYSSFGSYTGNGSATNGPFVFCNFRPAVVLVKMSSSTGNWTILDDKREGYNVDNDPLFPNLSNAEGTTDLIDITSNGFKVRTTDATFNTNAGTYVYAAWASSPFAYSRAR
jgi:hypothetical protein